jgi:hypothetical protein
MAASNRELRRRGYLQDAIDLAHVQREAEARASSHPRSLTEILNGQQARPRTDAAPEDLTVRQLRRRGRYGQAALLADQEAGIEQDMVRAARAREASTILKDLAKQPGIIEYDFFKGNVSMAFEFHDAVRERLNASGATPAERGMASLVLMEIFRWLSFGPVDAHVCKKTAAELAILLGIKRSNIARTLKLLEEVSAITRVQRGRTKIITVTPEGAYRGDIKRHAEAVDQYRAEVLPLRRKPDDAG